MVTQKKLIVTVCKDAQFRGYLIAPRCYNKVIENQIEIFIMLSGNQLISTIKSLPDADIKQVVKTCGYTSIQKNGTEKLNFTDFYVAVLKAKGSL